MKVNKHLKQVQKGLTTNYSFFKDENILVISDDKTTVPFAYVIKDHNFPKNVLVSFRMDYKSLSNVAKTVLEINKIKEIKLLPEFFVTKHGQIHFGEEGANFYGWELELPLEDIDPIDKTQH